MSAIKDCDNTFTKASELKKHVVAHSNPEKRVDTSSPTCISLTAAQNVICRLFNCSSCAFISLQKKNLTIHTGTHTGEKRFKCPHTLFSPGYSDSSTGGKDCEFRTNDPAALTRHRKAFHGYVPQSRGRTSRKGDRASRAATDTPSRPFAPDRRNAFLQPVDNNDDSTDSGYNTAEGLSSSTTLTWRGDICNYPTASKDADSSDATQYSSTASSVAQGLPRDRVPAAKKNVDPYFGFEWETLHVEEYNASYLTEIERLRPDLEMEIYEEDIFDRTTGCEGCLCPEWMVEAGIEGWDESVLVAHKDYYNLTSRA
ncbi:hypothetical protein BU15DRAFT_79973 [Melanogaster broomeanus]|nr:hypothetical protein BU15DRAFT_79973 [Melanogaster broomeanus]